jgi:hypothetical protein
MLGRLDFQVAVVLGMRLKVMDLDGRSVTSVPNSRCESCHENISEKSAVVGRALKIDHQACAAADRCSRCHMGDVHKADVSPTKSMQMFECLSCHNRTGASQKCDSCHKGRIQRDRVAKGTFAVTHGKNWRRNHGLGNMMSCSACHTSPDCGKCHGVGVPHTEGFVNQHRSFATQPSADCRSCHEKQFCTSCHGVELPHPQSFKARHAREVMEKGEKTCLNCHSKDDCVLCHSLHVHPGGALGGGKR